jgi:copper chaperone CopZ
MDLKVVMCCEKCEEKVKEEIEELDGKLLQVTHVFKFALKFKMTQDPGMT